MMIRSRHETIDAARKAMPVPGTKIRNDFESNRQYISDDV